MNEFNVLLFNMSGGDEMAVDLISHPKYGIIREFKLFEEVIEEQKYERPNNGRVHGLQSKPQRMVQISLPFL